MNLKSLHQSAPVETDQEDLPFIIHLQEGQPAVGTIEVDNWEWWKQFLTVDRGTMTLRSLDGEHSFNTNNIDKVSYADGFGFNIGSSEAYVGGDFMVIGIGWYTEDGHYQIYSL